MDDDNIKDLDKPQEVSPVKIKDHNGFNSIAEKRRELEFIQNDLNDLILRICNFVSDSQDFNDPDVTEEYYDAEGYGGNDSNGENQKDVGNEKFSGYMPVTDYYTTDGINPPEINWNILAPYIQSIVRDLQKLRNLNIMTKNVISRIRNVTGITQNIDDAKLNFEGCDKVIEDNVQAENEESDDDIE